MGGGREGRVGGRAGWVMGIEEGTFWDDHWVLYGNQFDNKFHILKKKNEFDIVKMSQHFHPTIFK